MKSTLGFLLFTYLATPVMAQHATPKDTLHIRHAQLTEVLATRLYVATEKPYDLYDIAMRFVGEDSASILLHYRGPQPIYFAGQLSVMLGDSGKTALLQTRRQYDLVLRRACLDSAGNAAFYRYCAKKDPSDCTRFTGEKKWPLLPADRRLLNKSHMLVDDGHQVYRIASVITETPRYTGRRM